MAGHPVGPDTRGENTETDPILGRRHATATQRYSIQPITSAEALSSLQQDWDRLSETAELPNVFMTYDWFRAWNRRRAREHRRGQRRLEVLVLKKDGVVAGIAPLIYRATSRFGFLVRRLESLASPADYSDLVVGDDPAGQIEAIVNFLVQTKDHWDLVDLKSLRETGNVKALIQSALSHTSLTYRILPEDRCPYLPIDASWSGVVSRLSRAGHRLGMGMRTLRNKQHRLERMGAEGLRVRIIESPSDEPGLLEKLIGLESQKRLEGKLMAPFLARYPEVFQSLFDTLGPRGWFYLALIELSDRPLAWLMGFRCGKKLWHYQTAYDHTFSRLSPGTMLFLTVLDYGFSHGYREYDFLTGDEPYKMVWSADFHETFRLQIWRRPWISWAYRGWEVSHRLLDRSEK